MFAAGAQRRVIAKTVTLVNKASICAIVHAIRMNAAIANAHGAATRARQIRRMCSAGLSVIASPPRGTSLMYALTMEKCDSDQKVIASEMSARLTGFPHALQCNIAPGFCSY
jgi:hypothetical protein